jgi:hypothetical protein
MAAGTITVTRAYPVDHTKTLMSPSTRSYHMFLATGSEDNLNPSLCLNYAQFTIYPQQQYILLANLMAPTVKVIADDVHAPLEFDHQNQLRMCYSITLKQPGMALIVGEKVPLTLLLKTGCINAAPFCLTRDQWFQLLARQNTYPKKRTAETVDAPSKKRCK